MNMEISPCVTEIAHPAGTSLAKENPKREVAMSSRDSRARREKEYRRLRAIGRGVALSALAVLTLGWVLGLLPQEGPVAVWLCVAMLGVTVASKAVPVAVQAVRNRTRPPLNAEAIITASAPTPAASGRSGQLGLGRHAIKPTTSFGRRAITAVKLRGAGWRFGRGE